MKVFIYIALFVIVFSFGYNLYYLDLDTSLTGAENRPYILGLAAGICGLILCVILLKSARLKSNLENRTKQ